MARLQAAINLDCPSCGEPLPTIPIVSTVGHFEGTGRGWVVRLDADLTTAWWDEVNHKHIRCVIL